MSKNKQEYSFSAVGNFTEGISQNVFVGLPEDIQTLLNKDEGSLSAITDELFPNKRFRITIKVEEI